MEMSMELDKHEMRTRADRADALIAWASIIGLALLLAVQLAEKAA
jgi:hypothetical protein